MAWGSGFGVAATPIESAGDARPCKIRGNESDANRVSGRLFTYMIVRLPQNSPAAVDRDQFPGIPEKEY